jgi:hypothetical protein
MTNVIGYQEKESFLGKDLREIIILVPPPAGVAIGVAVISYLGNIYISLSVDELVINDPDELLNDFIDEFNDFKKKIN